MVRRSTVVRRALPSHGLSRGVLPTKRKRRVQSRRLLQLHASPISVERTHKCAPPWSASREKVAPTKDRGRWWMGARKTREWSRTKRQPAAGWKERRRGQVDEEVMNCPNSCPSQPAGFCLPFSCRLTCFTYASYHFAPLAHLRPLP